MNTLEKIKADLKKAMKAGDKRRISTLRLLLSSLDYKKIEKREELTEAEAVTVLRSEEKKRLEAIEAYEKGGAVEKAEEEKKELKIIREYLPAKLSEEKIREEVEKVLTEIKPQGPGDFGRVMGMVMGKLKGRVDGGKVAEVVKERLLESKGN